MCARDRERGGTRGGEREGGARGERDRERQI
jgi:hypothetical protein